MPLTLGYEALWASANQSVKRRRLVLEQWFSQCVPWALKDSMRCFSKPMRRARELGVNLIPDTSVGKESQFSSWVGKICWRRDITPGFLGFPWGSAGKESACKAGDLGSISGLGRSPGKGEGYPLQYSGLENSMDYTVHGGHRVGHD